MTGAVFDQEDLLCVAMGAALLGSGGGGSLQDALNVLQGIADWPGSVTVQDYDGQTNACMLAMMGSPDAAVGLTLENVRGSYNNALSALSSSMNNSFGCLIPGEVGAINSLVPLLAAWEKQWWVVDGDGAGRAVPELPQTTFAGSTNLAASPCAVANDKSAAQVESAIINANNAERVETLAGGVVAEFGSFAGIALWPSTQLNAFALSGNYIAGTLGQAHQLGQVLNSAQQPLPSAAVAAAIQKITQRTATVVVENYYITSVQQATDQSSLDAGVVRLDNTPDPANSTATCYLYNLNESLLLYSTASTAPLVVAPDSICYYSETTGMPFSNATNDLADYYDSSTAKSTGAMVSIIKVQADTQLYQTPGVMASFAGLLRKIGYAGQLPYST